MADTPEQAAARIDYALMHDYDMVRPRLQQVDCPPLPPVADDTTFLRRACIDLAGRLPRPDEVRSFLADTSPDKRAKLTDSLAGEPGAAEVRFRMLAEAFRVKDDAEVIAWLRQAVAEDRPYAEVIEYMIGGGRMLQRDGGNAMRTSVETTYSLLGEDIHCAMCHDHAFNNHTQQECYEFAACFAEKNAVRLPNDYKYRYGKPGDVVQPAVLNLTGYRPYLNDEDKLTQVAKWIVQGEDGRRFAMVASLRIWNSLFGMPSQTLNRTVGGVDEAPSWHDLQLDPKPDQSPRTCSTLPPRGSATWIDLGINSSGDFSQAPKVLIEEFLRCGGRIGEFQRILARTTAYQRSGIDYNLQWMDCYLAPAPHIRRLPSEIIWKVVSGESDAQIPQAPPVGHPLRMLGRGTREWTDESRTPTSHELVRFMMNDKLIEKAAARHGNTSDLFLELLGREPSTAEQAAISHHAAADSDVAWALLNTTEFMYRP